MKRSAAIKIIKNRVVLKNFYKENTWLYKLRDLDSFQLEEFLFSKNLFEEATLLRNEQVDGMDFIVLLTEEEGIEILKGLNLSRKQIARLQDFYEQIFDFRMHFCKNFESDEIPTYLK